MRKPESRNHIAGAVRPISDTDSDVRAKFAEAVRKPGDILFDDTTTMVTDKTTGAQKGQKICRYDLIPAEALAEVAALYGKGANKYAEHNWEKGGRFSLNFGAMMRHAWRFWRGEDFDPETGMHHMSCVVFHAFAILTFQARDIGTDDRPQTYG